MPLLRALFKPAVISNSGSVAVLFALLTPVLFLFVGLAVDYTNSVRIKSAIQSEADSAVIAAAAFIGPESEALELAETYINNALVKRGLSHSTTSKSIERDKVTDDFVLSLTYQMPTRFAGLAGIQNFELDVKSAAAPKGGTRVLDIAMCIDATGSMQPTIDAVKTNALNFYTTLNAELAARRLEKFDAVQVRPIFFRDFGGNWKWYDVATGGQVDKYPLGFENRPAGDPKNYGDDVSMRAAADFFNVIDKQADLQAFVTPEIESGGGDDTESGLECLNEAIDSRWTRVGDKVTTANGDQKATDVISVIAIWTDENAHEPSFNYSLLNPNYPNASKMPRDYAGLRAKWDSETSIPQKNKLLATFMPPSAPSSGWDPVQAWPRTMRAGSLTDGTDQMVNSIVDAVSTIVSKSAATRLTR